MGYIPQGSMKPLNDRLLVKRQELGASPVIAGIPVVGFLLVGVGVWWLVKQGEKGWKRNPRRRTTYGSKRDKAYMRKYMPSKTERKWYMTYGHGQNMDSDVSGPYTYREAKAIADVEGGVVSHEAEVRRVFKSKGWAF